MINLNLIVFIIKTRRVSYNGYIYIYIYMSFLYVPKLYTYIFLEFILKSSHALVL